MITSSLLLQVYLILLGVQVLVEVVLDLLNMTHAVKQRGRVPSWLFGSLDEATFNRAIDYTVAKGRVGLVATLVSALFLFAITASGGFGVIEGWVSYYVSAPFTKGVVYILVLSFLFSIVGIPFSLYSTFVLEERFGFNRMTVRLWILDLLKGTTISLILLVPLLYCLLWFIELTGAAWWIYALLLITLFQGAVLYLFPVLVAPLFNKFIPLSDGTLSRKIEELAHRIGFRASGIFLMDGSKRSTHGNAYFTGFGRNKRIVLFDTLVNELSEEGTLAVLAHEMGHEKRHHILKGLVLSFVITAIALFVTSRLMQYELFFQMFGFEQGSAHAALAILIFLSGPITFFATPFLSAFSRKNEFEADRFAVDAVGNYRALSTALLTLSKKSLSNPVPHPLYSYFHYSHPALSERIEAMKRYVG